MEKQVLSIEEMNNLKKLGIDTSKASMCYVKSNGENDFKLCVYDKTIHNTSKIKVIPTFTLQDILEIIPFVIQKGAAEYFFTIIKAIGGFSLLYERNWELKHLRDGSILNQSYEMLVWLIEDGYLKLK